MLSVFRNALLGSLVVFLLCTRLYAESAGDAPAAPIDVAPHIDLREVSPARETREPAKESAVLPVETTPDETDQPPTLPKPASKLEPTKVVRVSDKKSLVLLGAEVRPGVSTRLTWSPDVAISGLALPTPVLVVNGAQDGPIICFTAAIHGDELNGIEIVRRVLYDIDPARLNGTIIGVPIVNLQGFQRGSRYLPDRRDLNRHFPGDRQGSLASRIAHSLFNEVLKPCEYLVDVHTGSLRRTNLPQLRADMQVPRVAEFTHGFDKMAVVHSRGSAGMLRVAAVEAGIVAVVMEVGESMRVNDEAIRSGVRSINSMLQKQGAYSRMFSWGGPEPVYYQSRWVRVESGGLLFSLKKLGSRVRMGDVMGRVVDPITNSTQDIVSPMDGRILGMAVDQVVMPGFAVYHIGAQASDRSLSVMESSRQEPSESPSLSEDEDLGDDLEE